MMDELKWTRDDRPGALVLILFGLLLWAVAMAQVGLFHRIPIFGAPVEITLAVVAYLGWRRGATISSLGALVGGVVLDALGQTGVSLCPILFVGAAVYMSFVAKRLFDHPLTYLGALLPVHVVMAVWRGVQYGAVGHAFAVLLGAYVASAVLYFPYFIRRMRRGRRSS